jgi:dihydroorotate dehydrogenase
VYRRAIYPALQRLDAEWTHDQTLRLLAAADRAPLLRPVLRRLLTHHDPRLAVSRWGLRFSNPLGVAAGLDKNAVAVPLWGALGWSHVEVGTVTPRAQAGNPRPRVFRLPADRALINRMGFPGEGAIPVRDRLARLGSDRPAVGVNVGANRTSVDAGHAAEDYARAIELLAPWADYVTINISSPNTARLRELQGRAALESLVQQATAQRDALPRSVPLLIKIAPDLDPAEIDDILDVCLTHGVDGLVATNTTLARPITLRSPARGESGGLSGAPLRERSTAIIRHVHRSTGGRLPIIGVGGVFGARDVLAMLRAGASLVQVYTGLIYEGPLLARRLSRDLSRLLDEQGLTSIESIIGSDSERA